VFEQSILVDNSPNKPWNFLASLSIELLVVSVAVLIPLAYSDHLPDFHWKDIAIGPAPQPMEPVPVQPSSSNAPARTAVLRPFVQPVSSAPHIPSTNLNPVGTEAPPAFLGSGPSVAVGTIPLGNITVAPPPPPPPVQTHAPAPSQQPMRVSGGVQMAKLIRKVIPIYPPLAKSARISGVVHLVGTIAKDGTIRNLQLISGHPLLARAAIEAVEQWVYQPTLLNGEPVEVIAPIDVSFTLSQ